MNRLGDCICAIPGKPPEEHRLECPVRQRGEAALDIVMEAQARSQVERRHPAAVALEIAAVAFAQLRAREGRSVFVNIARENLQRCACDYVLSTGAGTVQVPDRSQDARQGVPRRAAAPHVRLVEPSPPTQPLAFTGRFHVADRRGERCEACGLVLLALESLPEPLRQNCPGGPRRGGP